MQCKVSKKNVYNAGKGRTSQELIYLHMSNHYRRILNAKKAIDNSLPNSYKAKRPATSNPVATRNKVNRTLDSPVLTDRSLSTNSNKGSCWGTESYVGSSRYHARCIPDNSTYNTSIKQNSINMDLINQITYDTKHGPASYCDENWMKAKTNQKNTKQSKIEIKSSPSAKRRLPATGSQESVQKRKFIIQNKIKSSGVIVKGSKSCSSVNKKFKSKTLKTEAVSKLRSLRVYYPPRRKKSRNETQSSLEEKVACPAETPNCKCTKICVCDTNETVLKKISFNPKEQSLTSSRDSAYNGGVSSLPDSRSPTPDERRKKECCCYCCEKKQKRDLKFFELSKTGARGTECPGTPQKVLYHETSKLNSQEQQESLRKIQEDALYVNFVQDITTEVLEKNLYTNKALKKVMKKHITNNLCKLNKDRMLKEVENLRIQLGIPEDKTLLTLEADTDEGCSDVLKLCSVISDSEFVMPKNVTVKNTKGEDSATKTSEKTPKSINAVLTSGSYLVSETDDDGEVISVIHVTKAVREKRKERNIEKPSMMNLSDDSDRASDSNKQSVLKNFQPLRTYSSSSSDSDGSRRFVRKCREKTESEIFITEKTYAERREQKSSLTKKNRNVSFWKNPDLNLNQTTEIKQKKTIIHGKDPVVSNFKPKND